MRSKSWNVQNANGIYKRHSKSLGSKRLQRIRNNLSWDLNHKVKLSTQWPMGEKEGMKSQDRLAKCTNVWFE